MCRLSLSSRFCSPVDLGIRRGRGRRGRQRRRRGEEEEEEVEGDEEEEEEQEEKQEGEEEEEDDLHHSLNPALAINCLHFISLDIFEDRDSCRILHTAAG